MSSAPNGSLALQRIKLSNTLEIRNRIIFGFYSVSIQDCHICSLVHWSFIQWTCNYTHLPLLSLRVWVPWVSLTSLMPSSWPSVITMSTQAGRGVFVGRSFSVMLTRVGFLTHMNIIMCTAKRLRSAHIQCHYPVVQGWISVAMVLLTITAHSIIRLPKTRFKYIHRWG